MEYAPSVLSIETPSQRRSTGECPKPASATLPRCSHTPSPSLSLRHRYWSGAAMVASFLTDHRHLSSGDEPPLVDELAWGHLLERHLDGGSHRHVVGRRPRQVGVEIDPRILVQRHDRQIVRLIGHAAIEAAVLDHDEGGDMAFPLHLFPGQTSNRVANLAGLLWRVLQPVAAHAELQDEPPLVHGIPEGLARSVGDRD